MHEDETFNHPKDHLSNCIKPFIPPNFSFYEKRFLNFRHLKSLDNGSKIEKRGRLVLEIAETISECIFLGAPTEMNNETFLHLTDHL